VVAGHDPEQSLRNRRVVRIDVGSAPEVFLRRLDIAGAEVKESNPFQRTGPHGVEAQRLDPGIEGSRQVALVAENAGKQIVCIGQFRIAAEASTCNLVGRIQLPSAPQGFAQLQESEAGRLVRQSSG
jgi:hypothetical protein